MDLVFPDAHAPGPGGHTKSCFTGPDGFLRLLPLRRVEEHDGHLVRGRLKGGDLECSGDLSVVVSDLFGVPLDAELGSPSIPLRNLGLGQGRKGLFDRLSDEPRHIHTQDARRSRIHGFQDQPTIGLKAIQEHPDG